MKQSVTMWAALGGALVLGSALGAQEQPASAGRKSGQSADMKEQLQQVMQGGQPSAEHHALDPFAGDWEMVVRLWMRGPGAPPSESKSRSQIEWVLDGRFLREEAHSQLMGRPFTHLGYLGYDRAKKKYVSVWMDNIGTGLTTFEGTADAAGKVFTFVGRGISQGTGKEEVMQYVHRIVSPDEHVLTIYGPEINEKSRTVEITYTRRK